MVNHVSTLVHQVPIQTKKENVFAHQVLLCKTLNVKNQFNAHKTHHGTKTLLNVFAIDKDFTLSMELASLVDRIVYSTEEPKLASVKLVSLK